ncbi:MAG TPA: hypothetical protein VEA44_16350 [Caulobacter sp.]|nr:hypothetical protein [Caulobacter sp.]
MDSSYEWDGDWSAIESKDEQQGLEAELLRELSSDHVLHGHRITALARRWRRDDVLFRLDDGRFAQVHLTWRYESRSNWPSTEIYPTFDAWKAVPPEDR